LASGCRRGKQLVDEDPRQPSFVPVSGPAPVTDEQPVHLGGHECVNDVRSLALPQPRPQGPGPGQRARDPRLALLPISRLLGEQRRSVRIGARRADEDAVNGLGPRHDPAGDAREPGQLAPGVWVGKERADAGAVRQRDCLVVTGYGDVDQFLEDPELGGEEPVHRRGRDIRPLADGLDRRCGVAAFGEKGTGGLDDRGAGQAGPCLAACAAG
jgi:hypothetical protein